MEDQCQWIKKYGILVVALIVDVIAADPTVWKRVEAGDYAIVLSHRRYFCNMLPSFSFALYKIDVVHSTSAWYVLQLMRRI